MRHFLVESMSNTRATGPWANVGRTQMSTTSMYERVVWWLYLCFLNSPVTLYMHGVLRLIPFVLDCIFDDSMAIESTWQSWPAVAAHLSCHCHLIRSLWSVWSVFGIDVVTFRSFRHWCDIHTLNTAIKWISWTARFHDVQNCIAVLREPNLDWSLHQIFQICKFYTSPKMPVAM